MGAGPSKKLVSSVYISGDDENVIQKSLKKLESSIDSTKEIFTIEERNVKSTRIDIGVVIARKGTLADFMISMRLKKLIKGRTSALIEKS